MGETVGGIKAQEIRVGGFLKRSAVRGPGVRSVVWVQGCPIRCEGCFNPHLWDFDGGEVMTVDALFRRVKSSGGIDGVTFSGGEPFAQARALALLGKKIHERNLSVVTFTGYPYDFLIAKGRPAWQMLLNETDLLISGPFVRGIPPVHSLAGSGNQEIRFLTGRIRGETVQPAESVILPAAAEFTITRTGSLSLTGFPGSRLLRRIAGMDSVRGG